MTDEIKPITHNNLFECLSLIRVGFKMSLSKIERLHDFILTTNSSCGVFGYALYSSGSLVGAILTPYQGNIGTYSVVSLASLYILPSFRGYRSISFLRNIIDLSLANYDVITDYTPSKAVIKILKKFGFRNMQFISLRPDLIRVLLCVPAFLFNNLFGKNFYIKALYANHGEYTNNMEYLQPKWEGKVAHFQIIDSKEPLPISLSIVANKYKGFIPFLRILWSSNPEFICKNWVQIQFAFIVCMRQLVFADIPNSNRGLCHRHQTSLRFLRILFRQQ